MYAEHFRLRKAPFSIAPDPRFLYMSAQHREALAHLLYGVGGGGGFVLLTGEIGAGKTTVCRCFIEQIPPRCRVAYIFNPRLTVSELLQSICEEFHIEVPAGPAAGVKARVDALNAFLLQSHAEGRAAVLIIDEAQSLAPDVLEQLRLLTNLETHERKLLQIILIGQPELRTMLAQPGLEQLAQRVIARYHLDALSEADTRSYVKHRLAVAGGERLPFDREAMGRLHALSGGVPRRINLLADRALLGAYSQGRHKVDRATLEQAAREVFAPRSAARRAWPWAIGLGAGAAALGFAIWSVWPHGAGVAPPVAASRPASGGAGSARAASTGASTAGAASLPADAAGVAAPADALAPRKADAALDDMAVVLAAAHRSEGDALRDLAREWKAPLEGGDGCLAAPAHGLACHRSRAGLAALRQLARPAVLALRGEGGAAGHVVLVGLDETAAALAVGDQRWRVALPTLAAAWRGEFLTLWRPPPGWRPGGQGAAGAVDAWIVERLAAAGAPDPARPLAERIWAFQVASGLEPDGVPGPLTLMQLARAGGAAEPQLATAAGR
jgi:general secretion pathway protein A